MFWCRIGKKIYVKNAWGAAAKAGLAPGMEIVQVDGKPVTKWLDARIAKWGDWYSYPTDHYAFQHVCHWGLADPPGTKRKIILRNLRGKKKGTLVTYGKASPTTNGPAFFPENLKREGDLHFGVLASGYGYIHVRRCRGNLPEQFDVALAALEKAPGMILDWRGNSGGGFDHDALLGRFVPKGKSIAFAKRIRSAGDTPYGGPVVVIVDATVRSAGETGAGMFKEDGRAYMIGETPTSGMSSSKTTIELPSGLFSLYVAIRSNKARFNKGRGIEGIGVIPNETLEFRVKDLAAKKDTFILRAEYLLRKFPRKKVPYKPKDFGWKRR